MFDEKSTSHLMKSFRGHLPLTIQLLSPHLPITHRPPSFFLLSSFSCLHLGLILLSSHQPHGKSLIASAQSINVQVFLIHFTFSSVEAMDDREVATSVASSAGILIAIHMLSESITPSSPALFCIHSHR